MAMATAQILALAVQHHQAGRLAEAESLYRHALSVEPGNSDALRWLGILAHQRGNNAAAVQLIRQAIAVNPSEADFRTDLALVLIAMDRREEAMEVAAQAVGMKPTSAKGQLILGHALAGVGRLEEAVACYRQALNLAPSYFPALENLGAVLRKLGRSDEAAVCLAQCVALKPDAAKPHNNLAVTLGESGRMDESLQAYRRGLKLHPNYAEMHWGYSLLLLTLGDFKEGWQEFEWRLRSPNLGFNRGFSQPQWGSSDLAGKTLLLHAEGGLGDAIHFVRYVPLVARRGGTILLECQPELAPLLAQVPGVQRVIPRGAGLPAFDFHIPLQSLPRVFQTALDTIPASVPYLAASAEKTRYWQDRLHQAPGQQLKVGLAWAGSNTNSPEDPR
jgi:tetratricopeptide (TPR) repeat protein